MTAEGFCIKEIAKMLNLDRHTVEYHRRNLMNKLGIYDVANLTHEAIRMGIIPL
jgi:DNA-binding NarL/FixJ family response regulator